MKCVAVVNRRTIFRRHNGGRVVFGAEQREEMARSRQLRCWSSEQGGMLLGRLLNGDRDVAVDIVSRPHTLDRKGRFHFFRVREPAQKLVQDRWLESGGRCNYLGEWHTHPEPIPQPSAEDLRNWVQVFQRTKVQQCFLLFVIVGTRELRLWEQRESGLLALAECSAR